MLGYPGAGKTTTAEIIAQLTGAVHLASDKLRLSMFKNPTFSKAEHDELYSKINQMTEELLKSGKSVIYDANLNRYIHRQEKYDIAKNTGAAVLLVWIQADTNLAKRRATELSNGDPKRPYGNLDPATFDRLVDQIEPPRENEKHITLDGTKITSDYVSTQLGL